ncbi:MAG: hypothetical protein AAGU73_03035 [Actinomycetota bacterium]
MKRTIIIALSVVALVFGVISYATAAPGLDETTVKASVGEKFELTLATEEIDFGEITPGAAVTPEPFRVEARSNRLVRLDMAVDKGNFTTLGAAFSGVAGSPSTTPVVADLAITTIKGQNLVASGSVTPAVDFTVDAGTALQGALQYTLTAF